MSHCLNKNIKTNKNIYKNGNADSLANMPAMGIYNYDKITIREFKAENPELQKKRDIYNDKLNCTYDHEYQLLEKADKDFYKNLNSLSIFS